MKTTTKKKKRKIRWQIKLILIILFIILYAFFIGTKGILIKEFKIETTKINNKSSGFKILQFSDLHYGSSVTKKDVKKLVIKINQTKPDLVIFTGDLIDKRYKLNNSEKDFLSNELNKIEADFGKYYVTGEEDFKEATSILNLSNFVSLNTSEQIIYINQQNQMLLIDEQEALKYFENKTNYNGFKLLVTHNPDNFDDNIIKYNFDMAIAGHNHNGQINIPKLKNLLIDSKYKKTYQKVNKTKLYINPGIGTKKINVRLFNHPTIYLYRITKKG